MGKRGEKEPVVQGRRTRLQLAGNPIGSPWDSHQCPRGENQVVGEGRIERRRGRGGGK